MRWLVGGDGQTAGIRVRVAEPDDAVGVAAVYAPVVTGTAISFEIDPPGPEEMRRRIEDTLVRFPWIVAIDASGVVTGYAYAHPFGVRAGYAWSVETSIYVAADVRGRGVGSRLYAALLPLLRAQGFRRAIAGIALPNPASVALHERQGFIAGGVLPRVGWKFGAWHDVGRWSLDLDPDAPDPAGPPVPFSQMDAGS